MLPLHGTYVATVESVDDPEKLGRVKARSPVVYGPVEGGVSTTDLPWALPAGLPSGGSPQSGGMQWLPVRGDQVFLRFLDGEPEKPIWEWGPQTQPQAQRFAFRNYTGNRPDAEARLTRYGHTVSFSPEAWIATTRGGYALLLQDSNPALPIPTGYWQLRTAKGHIVELEDESDSQTTRANYLLATYIELAHLGDLATFKMNTRFRIEAGEQVQIVSPAVHLGTEDAEDPVVRKSDLQRAINGIQAVFNGHRHPSAGPVTRVMSVTATGSRTVFSA